MNKEEPVIGKDGEVGYTTGASYKCRLEGCSGLRVSVKWPDGGHTYPCTKGMKHEGGKWWIL